MTLEKKTYSLFYAHNLTKKPRFMYKRVSHYEILIRNHKNFGSIVHWYGDYRARNLQQEVYETKLEITIFPTSRLTKFKRLHLNNHLHSAQK